jgi:Predicted lipoprotein of unknown function (DUF2380)
VTYEYYGEGQHCSVCGVFCGSSLCNRCSAGITDHHIFPRQFQPEWTARGFTDWNDYSVTISQHQHQGELHPESNHDWGEWLQANPGAGRDEVMNRAAEMMEAYGIVDCPSTVIGNGGNARSR